MEWEPVEIAQKLRCGDWTRRTNDSSGESVLDHLEFMEVRYRCRYAIQYIIGIPVIESGLETRADVIRYREALIGRRAACTCTTPLQWSSGRNLASKCLSAGHFWAPCTT